MGLPLPLGLGRVSACAPGLLPWAWGINGRASVVAAVMASLLAIRVGFTAVLALALGLYAAAALLFGRTYSAKGDAPSGFVRGRRAKPRAAELAARLRGATQGSLLRGRPSP